MDQRQGFGIVLVVVTAICMLLSMVVSSSALVNVFKKKRKTSLTKVTSESRREGT